MLTDPFPIFHAMSGGDGVVPAEQMEDMSALSEETIKPYKVEEKMYDHQAELVLGKSMNLDRGSNTPFSEGSRVLIFFVPASTISLSLLTQREFNRLKATCVEDKVPPPSKPSLKNKDAEMKRLIDTPLTESDINAMLNRSRELAGGVILLDLRSRVPTWNVRGLYKHGVWDPGSTSVNGGTGVAGGGTGGGGGGNKGDVSSSGGSVSMKLSEKNRKANAEAVRRAEQQEAERKRKETKMVLMGGGDGSGKSTPVDPSARLKTVPRTMLAKTPTPGLSRSFRTFETLFAANAAQ
ncbi:hypothetical protein D9757_014019 [Collybiopsis confluens]|uniref:Uncharacterized protein n=1 Tax=Collybiopsis confluens TaxID=2823264 RepID=A0A8H5FR71_9AGAR|nr:hypothetical protein D9757_014019 [Collybiopsis confluens]